MKKHVIITLLIFCLKANSILCQSHCASGKNVTKVESKIFRNTLGTNGSIIRYDGSQSGLSLKSKDKLTSLIYSAGLWVGGRDAANNLKVAGTTYATQNDNYDWYPGTLNHNGQTNEENCRLFDRIFSVTKNDILKTYQIVFDEKGKLNPIKNCNEIPTSIMTWPAKGNPYWDSFFPIPLLDQKLAEFYDHDSDGLYNPCMGDLPIVDKNLCLFSVRDLLTRIPDQIHFWIINDNGGIHRMTQGDHMEMEVHNYMFTYDNEAYEEMVFYKFKCINKSSSTLNNTYLSIWIDPDFGCGEDDYFGTVSSEDLVFIYNQDGIDGDESNECNFENNGFGNDMPVLGITFVQGFRSIEIDEDGQPYFYRNGLTSSIYSNNCGSGSYDPLTCDPTDRDQFFYDKMQGKWTDDNYMTIGSYGVNSGSKDTTYFAFDGNPSNPFDWTMCSSGIGKGDRRIVMSTGGATIYPGASEEAIVAIMIDHSAKYPCPDVTGIVNQSKKAKQLMIDCWKYLEGPKAPEISSSSIGNKITLKFSNDYPYSNNKNFSFIENGNFADLEPGILYKFEGYKIYQVSNYNFDINNLGEKNSALIKTLDLDNGITNVYDWQFNIDELGNQNWVRTLKAEGSDSGVLDSLVVEYDYLLNEPLQYGKKYYYVVVPYAYNSDDEFDPLTNEGQKKMYLEGKGNVKIHEALINVTNDKYETIITRLSGQGNQNNLNITFASKEEILNNTNYGKVIYDSGKGPFSIVVFDESKIDTVRNFQLKIIGPLDSNSQACGFVNEETRIELTDMETNLIYISDNAINKSNQASFDELGFKLTLAQTLETGDNELSDYGIISQSLLYNDMEKVKWLNAIKNEVDLTPINKMRHLDPYVDPTPIRSSTSNTELFYPLAYSRVKSSDFNIPYLSPLNLEVGQFVLTENNGTLKLKDLNNVDVVFTSDKSKWSRCIVVETAQSSYNQDLEMTTLDDCKMMQVRQSQSISKDGFSDDTGTYGLSWFPGYAIDVETGRRLNIFFGENTTYRQYKTNAADMIFNPSSEVIDTTLAGSQSLFSKFVGGQHYIYVTRQDYDECNQLATMLKKGSSVFSMFKPIGAITWTCMPYLNDGANLLPIEKGLIPNDVTVKLRVSNPYNHTRTLSNIYDFNKCKYDKEVPTYQFRFVKKSEISATSQPDKKSNICTFIANFDGFSIDDVKEDVNVEVITSNGIIINKFDVNRNDFKLWEANKFGINNQLLFIKIKSKKSGHFQSHKAVMMW